MKASSYDEPYIETPVNLKARDIYFAVRKESVDYVRTKWLHTTQIELDAKSQRDYKDKYPSLSDYTFFSIECRENEELYARFASYADKALLVEPQYMRDNLKARLAEAAQGYQEL